jgi:hypothetical protein
MSVIGLGTVIYALVKYTFVGEILERAYVSAFGGSPIDELGDGLESIGHEIEHDLRQTARDLDRV